MCYKRGCRLQLNLGRPVFRPPWMMHGFHQRSWTKSTKLEWVLSQMSVYSQILVPHRWNVYPKPQFILHIRIHMCLDMDADCIWVYTHLHSYIDAHSTYTETHTDAHTNTRVHGHIYLSSHTQIGIYEFIEPSQTEVGTHRQQLGTYSWLCM